MSRIKRYVVCYDDGCLYLCDLESESKISALLTVDYNDGRIRFEGKTFFDVTSQLIDYINQRVKSNSVIYWRHFQQYYKDALQHLLLNGYSTTEGMVAKNKLVEWQMNYLVTKDNGVYRLVYKNGNGYVIDIHNLDKLMDLNDSDLSDFSDSYNVVTRVIDAVNYFKDNDLLDYLTIGQACFSKFLKTIKTNDRLSEKYHERDQFLVDKLFPSLKYSLRGMNGRLVWDYVYYAYRGGLCLCPKPNRLIRRKLITCFDRNSMYCSVMHSSAGNSYPVGIPFLSKQAPKNLDEYYYFIYIDVHLRLKKDGIDFLGIGYDAGVLNFYLTETDYKLMYDNYEVLYEKVNNYLLFQKEDGLFDDYINYWYEIKRTHKRGLRRIAKLLLNNLHGKFGTKIYGMIIMYQLDSNEELKNNEIETPKDDKYIPIGAAVFSYARAVLIDVIKQNKELFIYSDTDSVWVFGDKVNGVIVGDELGEWKIEHQCYDALFIDKKRYIIKESWLHPVDDFTYTYRVTWSGLPEYKSKILIRALMISDGYCNPEDITTNVKLLKFFSQYLTLDKISNDFYKDYEAIRNDLNRGRMTDIAISTVLGIPGKK